MMNKEKLKMEKVHVENQSWPYRKTVSVARIVGMT